MKINRVKRETKTLEKNELRKYRESEKNEKLTEAKLKKEKNEEIEKITKAKLSENNKQKKGSH